MGLTMHPVIIVTLGNELRGDDAAGIVFGRELIGLSNAIPVIEAGIAPENVVGKVANLSPDVLVLVDALDFGGIPGEMRTFPADLLNAGDISTHAALGLVIGFLEEFTRTEIRILGIQPKTVALGAPMTPEVAASVRAVAKQVCRGNVLWNSDTPLSD